MKIKIMRYLNYILLLFSLVSCKNNDVIYVEDIDNIEQNKNFKILFPEKDNKDILITLNLFNDSLQRTPFDSNIGGELNLELKFYKLKNKEYNKIFVDTVYVDFFDLNYKFQNTESYFFEDVNFDGEKDFLIQYDFTNRGFISNHLYLINNKESKISYINSFINYYNTKLIDEKRIISSWKVDRFDFFKIEENEIKVILSKKHYSNIEKFKKEFLSSLDSIQKQ